MHSHCLYHAEIFFPCPMTVFSNVSADVQAHKHHSFLCPLSMCHRDAIDIRLASLVLVHSLAEAKPAQSTICRESPTHQLRHFVGIAVLKRRPTVLWLCILVFLSVLFPTLCSNFCLEKNYLRLRFWFGGNLERELGEAFSPPQFTVRESEVSSEDFLVRLRKHSQMASCPLIFFQKVFP